MRHKKIQWRYQKPSHEKPLSLVAHTEVRGSIKLGIYQMTDSNQFYWKVTGWVNNRIINKFGMVKNRELAQRKALKAYEGITSYL